jgi:hypothetical protein
MGFIDNKLVAKFIAGGSAPALPPSHHPDPTPHPFRRSTHLPPGWTEELDPTTQKRYYLQRSTGRTQWVPPTLSPDSDRASILSGTTVGDDAQAHYNDVIRRNHLYLNLPTAAEREETMRKAEARRARKGPEKYVPSSVVGMYVGANFI